jgi:hypothetical protein
MAEIWTQYVPNEILERYHDTFLFGKKIDEEWLSGLIL